VCVIKRTRERERARESERDRESTCAQEVEQCDMTHSDVRHDSVVQRAHAHKR